MSLVIVVKKRGGKLPILLTPDKINSVSGIHQG